MYWSPNLACTNGLMATRAVTGGSDYILEYIFKKYIHMDQTCFRDPRPICSECVMRPQLWQCVGRTRSVFFLNCGSALEEKGWFLRVGDFIVWWFWFGDLDVCWFWILVLLTWMLVVWFLVLVNALFRTWGIVLVDLRPASLRAAVALRLV